MREIKFRCWTESVKKMYYPEQLQGFGICPMTGLLMEVIDHGTDGASLEKTQTKDILMQYTGLKDENGVEIYEGDIVEFSDKWEWYRCKYGISMMFAKSEEGDRYKKIKAAYEAEPMERRVVQFDPYDSYGLSKVDLESYWEIIGNIYQNPELLQDSTKGVIV